MMKKKRDNDVYLVDFVDLSLKQDNLMKLIIYVNLVNKVHLD